MGYNLTKRFSNDPEGFGRGTIEGVFAPETAAHASGISALLPMLALGIPGSGGNPARRPPDLGTQPRFCSSSIRISSGG